MKKPQIVLLLLLPALLSGCAIFGANVKLQQTPEDYSYHYTPDSTTLPQVTAQIPEADIPTVTQTPVPATEPAYVITTPSLPTTSEPQSVSVPTLPTETQTEPASDETEYPETPTAPPTEPSQTLPVLPEVTSGEVDLSIVLPDANGKMEVSTDPDNEFIAAVHRQRKIDPSLLAAVYAVPESGQNYVFEFNTATERTAESLRRVYLLQADGTILSVAASDSTEKENLSATENWFCMRVLIKNMIFPAVKDRM